MWDKISFGFDSEEETVNFGSRKMAICDSTVYETNTLAIISNNTTNEISNLDEEVPRVICTSYTNHGIVVAINESIIIFNREGNELLCNFSLNAKVDCYAMTSCQSVLFIVLNNGDLYSTTLNPNGNKIYLKNLCCQNENNGIFLNIFIQESDLCNLFIISSNGNLYVVKNIDLNRLSNVCVSQSEADIIEISNNLLVEYFDLFKNENDLCEVIIANEMFLFNQLFLFIVIKLKNHQIIQLWSTQNELLLSSYLSNEYLLKKVQISKNACLIYGLTCSNTLLVICPHTLTSIFHQNNETIIDFEIMDDDESNLLVYLPTNSLQLISIPGFEVKFKLDITETIFLARKQSSLDDLIYLEMQFKANDTGKKICHSIHLKIISESQPEYRLARILRRGKFDEAEEFARTFQLNIELVYKSHLQKLLNDIQPWMEEKVSLEKSTAKFKSLLEKVQDVEFVGMCALNTISSDFIFMKNVMKYAENRIKKYFTSSESKENTKITELYNQITNVLLRLNTFLVVSDKPLTVDKWLSFNKANLIEECLRLLKQEELKRVMFIWSRHVHQMNNLSYEEAVNFLRMTPLSISTANVLNWLQIFLPVCFSLYPKIFDNVVSWCKDKINTMELFADSGWPGCGLKFLQEVLHIIRENVTFCKITSENIIQSEYAKNSPLKEILLYIKILTEMIVLKNNYRINITIEEYTQKNKKDVIFAILDKVPLEDIKQFVKEFMEKLISMLQESCSCDFIISNYIQSIVEKSVNWWYWDEPPWETRVCLLINCIVSIQERLKCILCVLNHAPVPWSSAISNMCEKALKYKNPLTRSINEQKKMVECKLILKKYDLKDTKLNKIHIKRVLLYIFKQARSSMLEDALQIANTFDFDMCIEVYQLYVQHLIEHDEIEKALSFLDIETLSPKIVIRCCEKIILRTHCLSEVVSLHGKYVNYVETLDSVGAKLSLAVEKLKHTSEVVLTVVSSDICKHLKNVYYLKKNYQAKVTSSFLTNKTQQNEVMKHCLNFILKNIKKNPKRSDEECYKFTELSKCFECDKKEVYMKFVVLAFFDDELNAAIFVSRLLLQENKFSPKISKQLINSAFTMFLYYAEKYSCSKKDMPTVIRNLAVAGLDSCSSNLITKGLEISKWCRLIQYHTFSDSILDTTSDKIPISFSSTSNSNAIMKLLSSYRLYLSNLGINSFTLCLCNENMEDDATNVTPDDICLLENTLNLISEQEQENLCLQIFTTIHWSLLHYSFLSPLQHKENLLIPKTNSMIGQCIWKLLKKLIGSRHLDSQFGLALLHYFSSEQAIHWITETTKRFKYDFQRLNAVTELGMLYYHKKNLSDEWKNIYKLRKQCVWGKQIMEYGMSYKEAFRESTHDKRQLLLKLMAVPSVNIDVLSKYCRDLNISFQNCLKQYLKQVLLNWEPQFEVNINVLTGEKELIMKSTSKKLLEKCREIITFIENKDELSQIISIDLWDSVNYYYYEVFLILITLSEEIGIKSNATLFSAYRTVFLFLSSYQRISKPQEHEKDCWHHMNPNEQTLPAISEFRLPFRLLFSQWCKSKSDPWNIIKYELNFNIYTKWFAILNALELDKNYLCTLTINQVLADKNFLEESNSEWCLHLRNQKLLTDVQACVEHINRLEMASASLYFVINHLPPGADQVAAAKLCYLHAKTWVDAEKSEKAELGFQKVKKKYLTVSTTHVLYFHNLGKPHYLQLVLQPYDLINAIYNDPVILSINSGDVIIFPDINKAAEEISTLHNIDIEKIRMELLEEWLQPENFVTDISYNETIHKQHNDSACEKLTNTEKENFQRACYLVEKYIEKFGTYLQRIVFDQYSEDSKPISVRLRALQCLLAVATEDKLTELTNNSPDKLRIILYTLNFVAELEMLGLTYSESAFKSCDKFEILKSLMTVNNRKAVRLMVALCRYYQIDMTAVWNKILLKMCEYEMTLELLDVLPNLSAKYHTLDHIIFEKAWNTVLILPLEKAPNNPTEDQMEIIKKSINMIHFCPIIDKINIESIKVNCARINFQELTDELYVVH